jgi:ATP-dependent DNA helicase RecQ
MAKPRLKVARRDKKEKLGKGAVKDQSLFQRLRVLRKKLADAENVPAFVIFSDASIADMAIHQPTTPEAFLQIHGVGKRKLEKYGPVFLEEIQREKEHQASTPAG